jgi:hypothetical protein
MVIIKTLEYGITPCEQCGIYSIEIKVQFISILLKLSSLKVTHDLRSLPNVDEKL